MKPILSYLKYIPAVFIAFMFASHGIRALMLDSHFLNMISVIGLTGLIATVSLIIVGVVDLFVAFINFYKPSTYTLLYSAIWPIVPSFLSYLNGREFEVGEVAFVALMTAIAWYFTVYLPERA